MKTIYIFKPARWSWLGIVHFLGRESWCSPWEKEGAMGSCGIQQVNGMDWTSNIQARGSLHDSRHSQKGSPIKNHVPYFWIMLELFEQDAKPSILKWLQTYRYTVIFFKTLAILPPLLLLSNFDVPDKSKVLPSKWSTFVHCLHLGWDNREINVHCIKGGAYIETHDRKMKSDALTQRNGSDTWTTAKGL